MAVLTNGSLLWQSGVRRQLREADLVIPSLDAGSTSLFLAVNRPHPAIAFEQMIEGLALFREEYRGESWLEVFILDGLTANISEVRRIAAYVERIGAERVQLNTVTRPPAEDYALGVNRRRLEDMARLFHPAAEVIADFHGVHARPEFTATAENVFQMIERRPCTLEDIGDGLGLHHSETLKYIEALVNSGRIKQVTSDGRVYYAAQNINTLTGGP